MNIRAILYDLDGVLVEACEWHYLALNSALQEVSGTTIDRTEHETVFNGLPTKVKLETLTKQGRVRPEDHDRIWTRKQELTKDTILQNGVVDNGKIDLHVATAQKGVRSACVTNSISETATLMLDRTGQMSHMEFLISNEDVRNSKPCGEPYVKAMVKLGLYPEEVLIVEDSDKGMKSALSTGAHTLKVTCSRDVTMDRVLNRISEIEEQR